MNEVVSLCDNRCRYRIYPVNAPARRPSPHTGRSIRIAEASSGSFWRRDGRVELDVEQSTLAQRVGEKSSAGSQMSPYLPSRRHRAPRVWGDHRVLSVASLSSGTAHGRYSCSIAGCWSDMAGLGEFGVSPYRGAIPNFHPLSLCILFSSAAMLSVFFFFPSLSFALISSLLFFLISRSILFFLFSFSSDNFS